MLPTSVLKQHRGEGAAGSCCILLGAMLGWLKRHCGGLQLSWGWAVCLCSCTMDATDTRPPLAATWADSSLLQMYMASDLHTHMHLATNTPALIRAYEGDILMHAMPAPGQQGLEVATPMLSCLCLTAAIIQ